MPKTPRYYQYDALEALINFFLNLIPGVKQNACLVLPPGVGKSLLIAMVVKELYTKWGVRIIVLCHSSSIIKQNYEETIDYWPEGKDLIGINADQLGQRDYDSQIIFATIGSVWNNPGLFFKNNKQPFNIALPDECHAIPQDGDGMYLTTFDCFLEYNPDMRIAGFTASDWRLGTGRICKPTNILTDKIYEYPIMEAIDNGYLATPVNRASKYKLDRSKFESWGGDYTEKSVNKIMLNQGLIEGQIEELIQTADEEEREYWIVNCFGITHSEAIFQEIKRRGIVSEVIHSKIELSHRNDIYAKCKEKALKAIIQVEMLTEGINFPHLDLAAMFSPTKSSRKYLQRVGRILRVTPIPCPSCGVMSVMIEDTCQGCSGHLARTYQQKTGFVFDGDGNVAEHGAINCNLASPDTGLKLKKGPKYKQCKNPKCKEEVKIHLKICPFCNTPFPTIERENKTLARAAHDKILVEPEWVKVTDHQFFHSIKKGVIQHHLYLPEKLTNRIELESKDPLKREKAIKFMKELLGDDIPKTVESFIIDGYREKIPCPSEVLVTQQTGFRRLEEYRF